MKLLPTILIALFPASILGSAWAHGGGLNKEGCHTNRKTGDYHCHRSQDDTPAPRSTYAAAHQATHLSGAINRPSPDAGAFQNCTAARAAGAAPIRRGDPGYGPHLDRDNDGIGCEAR